MKSYIVIGLGRFGVAVAQELSRIGNEVLVIDTDEEAVQAISGQVTHAIIGDATEEGVLRSVGVRNFDSVVVAIGENLEHSVLITLALKDMGAKHIVCKAKNSIHKRVLEQVGADKVIIPEQDMGRRIAQMLNNPNVLDYVEISDDCAVIDMNPPADWIGKNFNDIQVRRLYDLLVIAVRKRDSGQVINLPNASYEVCEGDVLVVVGTPSNVRRAQGEA